MRITIVFNNKSGKEEKINFLAEDRFTEKAIKKLAKKTVKERWPHIKNYRVKGYEY